MSEVLETLKEEDKEKLESVGFSPDAQERAGSFILLDNTEAYSSSFEEGVSYYPLHVAVKELPWVKELMWKLVDPERDEYTKLAYKAEPRGYLIHVQKGKKVSMPLQACFFIKTTRLSQVVHNLIVIDEDASLHVINGCAAAAYVNAGRHIGITEIYVRKNAFLSYTMIHDWAEEVEVRPRTSILVEEGGTFISNYITIKKSKITQSYPEARLIGKGATAKFASLVFAPPRSIYDLGARIYLDAKGTKGEIISRSISGGGKVFARGHLIGNAKGIKAHMECDGLLLSKDGSIIAVPELEANEPEVEMSHEAAVGKIAEEEINYLMARGFSEEEAKALIIKGFLDTKILGLPEKLQREVDKTISLLDTGSL